jgi:hypothetical protein
VRAIRIVFHHDSTIAIDIHYRRLVSLTDDEQENDGFVFCVHHQRELL